MQALELWRRVLIANLKVAGDLSARQLALLLTVYMTPAPRTVRGLAEFLDLSPPVVNRAIYRLNRLGVLRRKIDRVTAAAPLSIARSREPCSCAISPISSRRRGAASTTTSGRRPS